LRPDVAADLQHRPEHDDPVGRPFDPERPVHHQLPRSDGRQPAGHDPHGHHLPDLPEAVHPGHCYDRRQINRSPCLPYCRCYTPHALKKAPGPPNGWAPFFIHINPKTGLITLHTAHTSYQMWADSHGVVHHLYYGPSVGESDLRGVEYYSDCGFSPQPAGMDRQRDYSLDTLCQEYTGSGVGDFRIGCLRLSGPDGSRAADFRFVSAEAVPGKYSLPGLPAAYAAEGECETLRLKLRDSVNGLAVTLLYGVFEAADVITRSALFENEGEGTIRLDKAASACLDLPFGPWELIHFQ